ncbi:hypothetical protein DESC_460115 [Desulfosarcina cetonica]|uniref:hypothetical protein n=1 Tax=Desulfosarcina cetonica TaxID=90730 RepID=UPI0006CFA2BD|nr:hypothetical protein [Desulfosarcina cetonica]VTR66220.1 hypothetical protein DESC_460115 [Desulfosarcina cetonica]
MGFIGLSLVSMPCFDLALDKLGELFSSDRVLGYVAAIVEKLLALIRLKRLEEATRLFSSLFESEDLLAECFHSVMDRIIEFVSQGFEREILQLLSHPSAKAKLEPLVVAKDVIQRIEEKRTALKNR